MLAIVLALAASGVWGYSTFLAGTVSRRVTVLTFVFWSQVLGLLPLLVLVPVLDRGGQHGSEILAGLSAGIGSGTSFIFLYLATRDAPVGIVASVAGVVGSVAPVLYAFARGARPSVLVVVGIVASILAILVVVSSSEHPRGETLAGTGPVPPAPAPASGSSRRSSLMPAANPGRYVRGVMGAAFSGLAICIYYVGFSYTSTDSRLWPVLESRVASSALTAAICVVAGAPLRLDVEAFRPALLVALSGVGGSVMYIYASGGQVNPAVVALINLSPAITVLLGWVLLRERLTRQQIGGLGLASVGVTLVVAGRLVGRA